MSHQRKWGESLITMSRDIRKGFSEMIIFKLSLEGHASDMEKDLEHLEDGRHIAVQPRLLPQSLVHRLLLPLRR